MSGLLTFRLGTASIALVFMAMAGLTSIQTHSPKQHGPHLTEIVGAETDLSEHPGPDDARHHSVLVGNHPNHGSSTDCTCLSMCDSGSVPNLPDLLFFDVLDANTNCVQVIQLLAFLIRQDTTSYLFPLPNAPPLQT